jgi:hypothetical protein
MRIRPLGWTALAWSVLVWNVGSDPATQSAAQIARPLRLEIVFDDSCDGMDLRVPDRLPVFGFHTGCNAGELVTGSQFNVDGETGVSVMFRDNVSGRKVRYDIYRTGFRAGRFYVFDVLGNTLVRYSTYSPAPPED